jgi:hypothetical protein
VQSGRFGAKVLLLIQSRNETWKFSKGLGRVEGDPSLKLQLLLLCKLLLTSLNSANILIENVSPRELDTSTIPGLTAGNLCKHFSARKPIESSAQFSTLYAFR